MGVGGEEGGEKVLCLQHLDAFLAFTIYATEAENPKTEMCRHRLLSCLHSCKQESHEALCPAVRAKTSGWRALQHEHATKRVFSGSRSTVLVFYCETVFLWVYQ